MAGRGLRLVDAVAVFASRHPSFSCLSLVLRCTPFFIAYIAFVLKANDLVARALEEIGGL